MSRPSAIERLVYASEAWDRWMLNGEEPDEQTPDLSELSVVEPAGES